MAHGHFRHSRIGNLISARRRREAELDGQDAGSDLLEDDTFQSPILPATGMPPEENCDSSKTSMRLEHGMNEFDSMLEKRDEAASPDPTSIETVLQIVDASSQTPLQSTTTDFPMTASDSTFRAINFADSLSTIRDLTYKHHECGPNFFDHKCRNPTSITIKISLSRSHQFTCMEFDSPRHFFYLYALSYDNIVPGTQSLVIFWYRLRLQFQFHLDKLDFQQLHNLFVKCDAAAGAGAGARSREVVERRESNDPLFTASYLAPAFMKRWRQSTATTRSGSTVDSAPSERGFQKISGRKLPPVFTHGGDGYGGGLDGDSPTITGFPATSPASGPIGSPSFYAPPPAQPYGMPLDSNYTREVEEHTPPAQPNPVHLPISNAVSVATPITVTPAQPIAQPQSAVPFAPPRPDGLGRSLHSFDGSRSSRFTEVMDQ
ncbi:hypothetical protein E8E15_006715 [Penicillium rubens]|nr:hypothetical protein E8E15_006715 [Penicillium rubens]